VDENEPIRNEEFELAEEPESPGQQDGRREAALGATRARPIAPGRVANLVSKLRWISGFCCCFSVLYAGEVSGESCPLLLLMGKNSF
jgi:hypothetical protein